MFGLRFFSVSLFLLSVSLYLSFLGHISTEKSLQMISIASKSKMKSMYMYKCFSFTIMMGIVMLVAFFVFITHNFIPTERHTEEWPSNANKHHF